MKSNNPNGHNFTQSMPAELLWHLQNCYLIGALESKLGQKEFLKYFNYECLNCLWNKSLVMMSRQRVVHAESCFSSHWGLNKMDNILLIIFLNAFSSWISSEIYLNCVCKGTTYNKSVLALTTSWHWKALCKIMIMSSTVAHMHL